MKEFPIDLSCLTEEEISQFQEDPYTLYNGDQNVAIYLRYSSTGQSDQSIEGQLRDCRTFCKANHYRIVAIYVDRATTARKDVEKRVHLMEMVYYFISKLEWVDWLIFIECFQTYEKC